MGTMIVNAWLQMLANQYGGFPRDYIVLDLETTGFDAAQDLIVNIGHVIVEDGQVTSHFDAFLDWEGHNLVDGFWLQARMERVRQNMADKGREYKMSPSLLREQGADPRMILDEYRQLIEAHKAANYAFVMHNGYNFDAPRLCSHFQRWLGKTIDFGPNEIWDTGMIEKASQINMLPDRNDSMRAWSRRVGGARIKGVNWSLDTHVMQKYGFAQKHNLDASQAHGAAYDAYITHLLFEEYRRLASQAPVPNSSGIEESRYDHLGG